MGGRRDLGPPTPFPSRSWFCFPGLPLLLGLLLPSPSSQGSLENQEQEKAQAWVSYRRRSPFPRGGCLVGKWVPHSWLCPSVEGKAGAGRRQQGPIR